MTRAAFLIALLVPVLEAQQLSFIACPIVRDTKTVPCWLAEYEGELYYLGVQEDIGAPWFPPQQSHEVLVEGTVKPGPRVCGGIPLSPLSTSVMPELTRGCNTVLTAKDEIEAPAGIYRGPGPGPSSRPREEAPEPKPPFIVYFDFSSDQMPARSTKVLENAVAWFASSHATHLELTVYRGSVLLSDGRTINEDELIASRRASKIAAALKALGIPAAALSVKIETTPAKPDGLTDPANRRAVISVTP